MAPPSRETWVRSLLPLAQTWERRTGIPASMWLAMAASESNWGNAGNALFGIKGQGTAGGLESPTWESVNGQRVNTTDTFRNYRNANEAFQGFWNFLHDNPRYADALQQLQRGNSAGFIQSLNQAGYATDPNWANSIQSIATNQIEPIIGSTTKEANQDTPEPTLTDAEISQLLGQDITSTNPNDPNYQDPNAVQATTDQSGSSNSIAPGGYGNQAWQAIVQQHGGIASVGSSRTISRNDPLAPDGVTTSPDPNAPSIIAFNDGTVTLAKLSGDQKNPSAVQVVPFQGAGTPTDKYLGSSPNDKYIIKIDPRTGALTPTKNPNYTPPPNRTTVSGASSTDQYILQTNPTTGEITKVFNPNYVKPKPQLIHRADGSILSFDTETGQLTTLSGPDALGRAPVTKTWPDGSEYQYDSATGNWKQIAPPDPQKQQEASLRIAQAQKNLQPAQQKLFQDAQDSIDEISRQAASGNISYTDANALVSEIHQGLRAALAGTTLFDQYKQQETQKQARATEAATMLRQRMTDGTNLAHSLLTAAAGHILMPSGQSTLGIDPFAIAKAETTDLGGGMGLFDQAGETLKNFIGSNDSFSGIVPSGTAPSPPGNPTPSDALHALLSKAVSSSMPYPAESGTIPTNMPPASSQPAQVDPSGGPIVPYSLEGPSVNAGRQALAPRGPSMIAPLLQALMGSQGS